MNPLRISEDSNIWAPGGEPDFTGEMWKFLPVLFFHKVLSQDSFYYDHTDGSSNQQHIYNACVGVCAFYLTRF